MSIPEIAMLCGAFASITGALVSVAGLLIGRRVEKNTNSLTERSNAAELKAGTAIGELKGRADSRVEAKADKGE